MENQNKKKCVLHGECSIVKIGEVDMKIDGLAPVNDHNHKKTTDGAIIIADSETTGNHHIIRENEGCQWFATDRGTKVLRASRPVSVECVVKERHSKIDLEPGSYEIGFQQEFDYLNMMKANVRD
jgi:hypothetical protein